MLSKQGTCKSKIQQKRKKTLIYFAQINCYKHRQKLSFPPKKYFPICMRIYDSYPEWQISLCIVSGPSSPCSSICPCSCFSSSSCCAGKRQRRPEIYSSNYFYYFGNDCVFCYGGAGIALD